MHRCLKSGAYGIVTVPFLYAECDARDFRRWTIEGFSTELSLAQLKPVEIRMRGGAFFCGAMLSASFVHLLFPRHRSWRASRNIWGVVRAGLMLAVTIPFWLLAYVGQMIDLIVPIKGFYMGSIVIFRKGGEPGGI